MEDNTPKKQLIRVVEKEADYKPGKISVLLNDTEKKHSVEVEVTETVSKKNVMNNRHSANSYMAWNSCENATDLSMGHNGFSNPESQYSELHGNMGSFPNNNAPQIGPQSGFDPATQACGDMFPNMRTRNVNSSMLGNTFNITNINNVTSPSGEQTAKEDTERKESQPRFPSSRPSGVKERFSCAAVGSTGNVITVTRVFDSGRMEASQLFTNVCGPLNVARAVLNSDYATEKFFALIFGAPDNNMTKYLLLPDKIRMNVSKLIAAISTANIVANPSINERVWGKALSNMISEKLYNNPPEIAISSHAGWNGGKRFLDMRNAYYNPVLEEKCFPILRKDFNRVCIFNDRINEYFSDINQVPDPFARFMLVVFPVMGLLYTLLSAFKRPAFFLNILSAPDSHVKWISDWLQIFNRKENAILQGTDTHKNFDAEVAKCSDEVIIVDVRSWESDLRSERDNKRKTLERISGLASGRLALSNRGKINVLFATVSNDFSDGNVVNIEVPDGSSFGETVHDSAMKNEAVETFLTGVVNYVESNYDRALNILSSARESSDNVIGTCAAVWKLVDAFLAETGLPLLADSLKLPVEFDVSALTEGDSDLDLIGLFKDILRKSIKDIPVTNLKKAACYMQGTIYYDSEVLYIPPEILKNMFDMQFRRNLLTKTVGRLRSNGFLITNNGSNICKVQIRGVRKDYYAVKRKMLSKAGEPDILSYAKIMNC